LQKCGIFKFEPLSIKLAADTDLLKQLQHYWELRHWLHKYSDKQLPVNADRDGKLTGCAAANSESIKCRVAYMRCSYSKHFTTATRRIQ